MKHYIAAITLLLATAAVYAQIQSAHDAAVNAKPTTNLDKIPASLGEYVQFGADATPDEDVQTALETSGLLMRTYRAPSGRYVQLSIVYAGTTRRSLHFPEVCLVGQGWEIQDQTTMPISFLFEASRIEMTKGEQHEAVLYWYKTGNTLTGSFFTNSWYWAWEQLTKGAATSAMVRVSTPILGNNSDAAFKSLESFASQLTPVLDDCID